MVDGNKKHKQNPSQVKHINDQESDGSGQHRSNTCQRWLYSLSRAFGDNDTNEYNSAANYCVR